MNENQNNTSVVSTIVSGSAPQQWTNHVATIKVKPSRLLRKFKKMVEEYQQKDKERLLKNLYG
jgi:hypothetical protein